MISDLFPLDPPKDWFYGAPDGVDVLGKLSVITEGPDAGRAFGLVADKTTCILNGAGGCWTAPESPTGYEDAMQGDTPTADGETIKTATIAMDMNHVGPRASFAQAVNLMTPIDINAHTGAAVARVRYVDTPQGVAAFGSVWPGITDIQLRKLQASALSGDWRWRDEYDDYDFAGAIAVNNPGLPLPNRQLMAASICAECPPMFQPFAMAASLSSDHPPILGSWSYSQENPVENQIVTCGGCGAALPAGTQHPCFARPATLTPFVAAAGANVIQAAPGDAPADAPAEGDLETRVADLEARLDAVEGWLADNAMSEMDAMPASLPEPETAATA